MQQAQACMAHPTAPAPRLSLIQSDASCLMHNDNAVNAPRDACMQPRTACEACAAAASNLQNTASCYATLEILHL